MFQKSGVISYNERSSTLFEECIMDDSLARLQGKLKDTSEKLENYNRSKEQAATLKNELSELLKLLENLPGRQREAV